MPDDIQVQTPAPVPEATPAPSAPSVPAASSVPEVSQAAASVFELRNYFAEQLGNPDLAKQFNDDKTFAAQLVPILQHAPVWRKKAEYGDRYMQHAAEFEKWFAEQQQKKQAEAVSKPQKWWTAPEFDPSWEQAVVADPQTGELVAKPGYDPTIPSKIARYRDFQRQKLNEFFQDPMKTIQPGIEQVVQAVVEKALQQHTGEFEQKQFADSFLQQNSDWLFQSDPVSKQLIRDVSGKLQLSPAGHRFRQHVSDLEKAGVTNLAAQQSLAQRLTEGDLLRMAYTQQQNPAAPAQPAAPASPQAPAYQPNALAGSQNLGTGSPMPLKNRLQEAFEKAGITDDVIRNGR